MTGPSSKAGRSSNPEVLITSQKKVSQPSAASRGKIGKGVSTRMPRKASSQAKDKAEDTDSGSNNGDERPSDDDWCDPKKSRIERDREKAKERLKWITNGKWKSTPNKKKGLSYNEYWNMILLRDKEIERLRDTIRQKKKTIAELRDGKVQRLNDKLQGKSTKLEDVQRDNDSLKITLQELQGELEKSKGEVDAREVAISGMAAERLNLLDKSDMPFLPDDVVTTTFNKLFRETREWVKKWVIADWSKMQQKDAKEIARRLQHNMPPNFVSQDAADAVMKGKIPTRVVLLAIVNATLCRRTFMRPFDLVKTTGNEDAPREGKDRLQTVYNYLTEHTSFAAHRLRALTLLAYSPLDETTLQLDGDNHPSRLNDLVSWSYEAIFREILRETDLLIATTTEEKAATRERELVDITWRFIRASIALLAQYPWLELRFRSSLMDVGFCLQHRLFTWHRALKLKEEDDDQDDDMPDAHQAGIEGKPLDLVIEPTVVRHGEKDGTAYDNKRVLLKANIWEIKPGDLKGKSRVGAALSGKAKEPDIGVTTATITGHRSNSKLVDGKPTNFAKLDLTGKASEHSAEKGNQPPVPTAESLGSSSKQAQSAQAKQHIKEEPDADQSPLPATRTRKRSTEGKEPTTKKRRTSPAAGQEVRMTIQTPGSNTVISPNGEINAEDPNRALDDRRKKHARTSRRRSDSDKVLEVPRIEKPRHTTPERAKSELPEPIIVTTPELNPEEHRSAW